MAVDCDPRAGERKRMLKNIRNPNKGLVWRFLVCCLTLDACIWGYFTFIEKVPVLVGLQRIYDGIHKEKVEKKNENFAEKKIIKVNPIEKQNQHYEAEKSKPVKETFYSWKTKDGKRGFSNVGFPSDGAYTEGKIELNK